MCQEDLRRVTLCPLRGQLPHARSGEGGDDLLPVGHEHDEVDGPARHLGTCSAQDVSDPPAAAPGWRVPPLGDERLKGIRHWQR